MNEITIKVIIIGSLSSGKSSLLAAHFHENFKLIKAVSEI